MLYARSICWLRRDLRLRDNSCLSSSTLNSKQVYIVFIFDTCILKKLKDKELSRLYDLHPDFYVEFTKKVGISEWADR